MPPSGISIVPPEALSMSAPGSTAKEPETRIRLRGKGVPSIHNKDRRGDHYVTLVVQVPTKLNREQKKALQAYAKACGEDN